MTESVNSEEHPDELLAAYALGALETEEGQQVIRHLDRCASCRLELDAYEMVVAHLPEALPQAAPPPQLKRRLFRRIRREEAALNEPEGSGLPPRFASLALLLLLVVALGIGVLFLADGPDFRPDGILDSFEIVRLTATENSPGATGVMMISHDAEYGTLIVQEIPSLPPGEQCQLWLARGDTVYSGGTFSLEDGYGSQTIEPEQPLTSYTSFFVTSEPTGGSPQPTGPLLLTSAP